MQTTCILFFLIVPVLLEGCCNTHHQQKGTGVQRETTIQHYRVVEGESFMMPCVAFLWFKTTEGEELKDSDLDCGKPFQAQVNHSGKYTSKSNCSQLVVHLQVVEKNTLGCFHPEENSVTLSVAVGGNITCPGFNCSDNTNVIWYKSNKLVSEQPRDSCENGGRLDLCQVTEYDEGVYFCDRQMVLQGVTWTFRRTVHVTIRHRLTNEPPEIMYPDVNMTEEVELGQPHTLTCWVRFHIKKGFSPRVQWYLNYDDNNMETLRPLESLDPQTKRVPHGQFEFIQRAIIKEVTPQHLNHRYTCIASTSDQTSRATIQFKKKTKVKWPLLVGYPIVSFLILAGLGVILHVKWLELQIIYRSHFQHGKHDGEKKDFDVLLSYVWSPTSGELTNGSNMPSRSRPFSTSLLMDLDKTEEDENTQTPLEVLLPQVIERQWGYRLCLLDRDVLPGGAYTNDVLLAIKRSRMLICILSTDYLTDSNAVFVLESGVQALLQNSVQKLLLIWTNRDSASLIQTDPPIPGLVQRALKVLPSLDWSLCKSAKANRKFWKSLQRVMPNHRHIS